VNAVTIACGAGAIVTAFVGAVSTCLTGPVNAIISSSGEKAPALYRGDLRRSACARLRSVRPFFTRLMLAAPKAFIAALAALRCCACCRPRSRELQGPLPRSARW